ncbi:ABC-type transport system permease protein [Natrialba magadii ATCC 43099]|uniref:ABC-type transport system permease protein n=2 Tax=Natrialba magadii (strain ATCC 43099 / DSM 3394 / CCM 3739 / CIP 104546 / IAM 13178 / JCM 8861 / NBRC 102185 / NCIMB 2190 / MS3) TaxID=547559 RepID=D3SXI6_NATMM|nr:ABC-type transport system permease protein [Natrialba magadii ATCC 43099]
MSRQFPSRDQLRQSIGRTRSMAFPTTERDRERRRIIIMCLPFFVLATFAGFVPLIVMARMSLSAENLENAGWSLAAWETLLTEPVYREIAWNTLWFATVATVVSVALGVVISHVLEKYSLPLENVLVAAVSFPIALPGIVVAFMVIVLLGRQGLVTNAVAVFTGSSAIDLATATTVFGLFLGYVYSLVPRATMVLRGTYAEVDTRAEEAARSLGATPLETFYHVTLPEIRPGIVAAFILTFRSALAIFGTVLILQALAVVTLRIDYEIGVGFNTQIAGAIGLVYALFLIAFTFVGLRFVSKGTVEI